MSIAMVEKTLSQLAAESIEKVSQYRTVGRELAKRMADAISRLGDRGCPIDIELLKEYDAWSNDFQDLKEIWDGKHAFSSFRPENDDLQLWREALVRFHAERQSAANKLQKQLDSQCDLLERIQKLKCNKGDAPGLEAIQQQAGDCLDRLDEVTEASDASVIEQALKADGDTLTLCEDLWVLVRDAHGVSPIDEGSREDRAERLGGSFGMSLLMHVWQQRIAPTDGWPLSSDEAKALLTLGNAAPPEPATQSMPIFNGPVLEDLAPELTSLRARVRSAGDSARLTAEMEEGTLYARLAECFDTLHAAIGLAQSVIEGRPTDESEKQLTKWRPTFQTALQHMATAQSALRKFHLDQGWDPCNEQNDTYYWLNHVTKHPDACYLHHMKLDDLADPAHNGTLKQEIDAARLQSERPKRRKKLLKKLNYELGNLTGDVDTDLPHWETIVGAVDTLIQDEKLPPSNKSLREILLPHYDDLPEDLELPDSVTRVLDAFDEYLFLEEAEEEKRAALAGETVASPLVDEVAQLLRGKKLQIVGGISKESALKRLEESFDLSSAEWLETRVHESTEKFKAPVTHPDVYIVCLLIRLSGHDHIDSIKAWCKDAGKHCVLLPSGYGVKRVAHDILNQCGDRLREGHTA